MPPNLFDQAERTKRKSSKSARSETVWKVGDDAQGPEVAAAIAELAALDLEESNLKVKIDAAKAKILPFAEGLYLDALARDGVAPEPPMHLTTPGGQSACFVVADKSRTTNLKDDQLEQLAEIHGDQAAGLTCAQKSFGFNPDVMIQLASPDKHGAERTVQDAVGLVVSRALTKLVKDGVITGEQLAELVTYDERRILRPGVLARLAELCGRSIPLMRSTLEAIGSACSRYVKAG